MVAKILEGKYPGKIFSVYTDVNPDQAALLGLKMGRLKLVRGTAAGKLSFVRLVPNASARIVVNGETVWKPLNQLTWPAVEDVVDGFLYLGPDSAVAADPAIYRDPTYQAELRRRAPILKDVYSLDFLPELEALLTPPVK